MARYENQLREILGALGIELILLQHRSETAADFAKIAALPETWRGGVRTHGPRMFIYGPHVNIVHLETALKPDLIAHALSGPVYYDEPLPPIPTSEVPAS